MSYRQLVVFKAQIVTGNGWMEFDLSRDAA